MMADADDDASIRTIDVSVQYHEKGFRFPNDAVTGMRILGTPTDGKAMWVVVADPRGFKIRARLEHVWKFLSECETRNGVVRDPCVWVLQGPYARPMSILSDEYITSVRTDYLHQRRVPLRKVKRGNKVSLQDGTEGIYLGLFRGLKMNRFGMDRRKYMAPTQVYKRYLYFDIQHLRLREASTLNVAEVLDSREMTLDEVHEFAHSIPFDRRDWMLSNTSYFAPTKFDLEDVEFKKVKGFVTQKVIDTRAVTFYPEDGEEYTFATDWRDPRRQFDYVRSPAVPTLWMKLKVILGDKVQLDLDHRASLELMPYYGDPVYFLEVSVGGKFPSYLSGRLPR